MEEQIQSLTRQLNELTESLHTQDASLAAQSAQLGELSDAADAFSKQRKGHFGYVSNVVGALSQAPALAVLSRWGVFKEIPQEGAISYKDLAAKVDADAAIISRSLPVWLL